MLNSLYYFMRYYKVNNPKPRPLEDIALRIQKALYRYELMRAPYIDFEEIHENEDTKAV